MSDDPNFVLAARREKLDALRAAGVEPFAYSFARTHSAHEAVALAADDPAAESVEVVRVAGRIASMRAHGKTTFAHLVDGSGRVQLYFRRDEIGDAYTLLDLLDIGDVIGVTGVMFRTRSGEPTVRASGFEVLAKSLRPLPFGKEETAEDGSVIRHSGFSDPEQRFRQRYADLAVNPEVRATFVARARMTSAIRSFLDARGYLEVETPVLQPLYGGAAARPFTTRHNALDMSLFLRIADELYLKRLIVGGLERVYEIGHDFRNEGIDRTHNPEFTMLEFYEAYADYEVMMDIVERLIVVAADAVRAIPQYTDAVPTFTTPFARKEWLASVNTGLGEDILAEPGVDGCKPLLARKRCCERGHGIRVLWYCADRVGCYYNQPFDDVHHHFVVRVRLVKFQHRELRIVSSIDTLVTKVVADFINALEATLDQPLEVEFIRNAEEQ